MGGKECAIIALNVVDGSTAWEAGGDRASYTPTIPVTFNGTTQILSYLAIATYGSDPESGENLWYNLWGSGYSPHGTWPLYREPYLYRTHPFRRGCRVDRIAQNEDTFSLEPVWINKEICADFFSSILVGDYIYGFDVRTPQVDRDGRTKGEFVCIDFATGERQWRTKEPGHSSVIASDGKLIMLNERGELIIIKSDHEQYVELERHTILPDETCWTMPTISRGYLVARNQREAVCIYLGANPPASLLSGEVPIEYETSHWLDKYDSQSTWMPDWSNLALWYAVCVLTILVPSWLLSMLVLRGRTQGIAPHIFLGLACITGTLATRAISELLGRFIFTWPVVLFASLIWIQLYALRASDSGSLSRKILSRVFLILFAGLCVLFWHICGRLFLLGGWGFLTGFLPAVPLLRIASSRMTSAKHDFVTMGIVLSAFTVYFWFSAIILIWKAGIEPNLNAF